MRLSGRYEHARGVLYEREATREFVRGEEGTMRSECGFEKDREWKRKPGHDGDLKPQWLMLCPTLQSSPRSQPEEEELLKPGRGV